jgi:ankyrin repeat protein
VSVKGKSGTLIVISIFGTFLLTVVYIVLWLLGGQPDALRAAALRAENHVIAQMLEQHPEWVDFPDKYGMTPLHQAMTVMNEETVKLLVDRGASLNATNHFGSTPLHLAANATAVPVAQQKRVLELLIKRGANPALRDKRGRTALGVVNTNARSEIAVWLRERGVAD